ncbi:MAG: DNA repair protein RecN [Eubacteriales bacterium]|nr:DNA repair protein RecN [Eubacteriales bacterium]
MLQEIHVKNLALIEEANVEFNKNLNILTGETGAGKSILLGSINLCLGKRANKELIKDENKETSVELVFTQKEYEDNIIIKRTISKEKSSAKINGENVTLAELKEYTSKLIDIYGQHDSEDLRLDSKHIDFIDKYNKNIIEPLKTKVAEKYELYKSVLSELEFFNMDENLRIREMDLLKYEIEEIEEANLKVGEEEELEAKYKKYAKSTNIINSINNAKNILSEQNISLAQKEINNVLKYDASLTNIYDSLNDANQILEDTEKELDSILESYDINEEEFTQIENRLNLIRSITMKNGGNVEKTLEKYNEKSEKLKKLEDYENAKKKCNEKIAKIKSELYEIAKVLSNERKKTSKNFERELILELKDLGFLDVKFEIEFKQKDIITKNGFDTINFYISLNVGEPLKPLTEIASGGELSRIMLSIKTILANMDDTNTLIFDEIDQGISGITAAKVANKLYKIAQNRQIICITHLPQIAAKAQSHYEIKKEVSEGHTYTIIKKLNYEEEIKEIARLMSSGELTESALKNAKEMKNKIERKE